MISIARTRICAVLAVAMVAALPSTSKADALKDEAIARLAASHDPEIPIAIGRVVVKQAGMLAARELLAREGKQAGLGSGWNATAPEWQAAEQALAPIVEEVITRRLEQGDWLREGWARVAASALNAEEADEIATHFATEGGREQRVVVEMVIVGETVMANYTFTDRLDYRTKGTEREVAKLQETWWAREPLRVRDFSRYPGAMRFAGENPGVKYTKTLAIQGIEVITRRIDQAAAEASAAMAGSAALVAPYIEAYRARRP